MTKEQIQNALFAAYDLRNTLTKAELRRPIYEASFGETIGSNIDEVIETLEQLEKENRQ